MKKYFVITEIPSIEAFDNLLAANITALRYARTHKNVYVLHDGVLTKKEYPKTFTPPKFQF